MKLSNAITLLRVALIPVMVLFFYLPFSGHLVLCAVIFAIAALTDFLDGYVARSFNQVSSLGEFLDPVADKLLVICATLLLLQLNPHFWFTLPAMIIIGRELAISALREWMAKIGERQLVRVSFWGKLKAVLQMIAITILLATPLPPDWHWAPEIISTVFWLVGMLLLYVAVVSTLYSMYQYLWRAWPVLRDNNE